MKNTCFNFLLTLVHVISLLDISLPVSAQNLPTVQNKSLIAPADVKVDGNPMEWGDKFMAYNRSNYVFFSIANDANNLYLVVHIRDWHTIQKVLFGGITLTIESPRIKGSSQSENNSNIKLRFPVSTERPTRVQNNFSLFTGRDDLYKEILDTVKTGARKRDSMIMNLNKKLANIFRDIEVAGIKEIEEPVVSIYNTDGLKAAARFDEHLQYTYELAIPLKFFNTAINGGAKFKYIITENGKPTSEKVNGQDIPLPIMVTFGNDPPDQADLYLFSATNLSGTYTLIKK